MLKKFSLLATLNSILKLSFLCCIVISCSSTSEPEPEPGELVEVKAKSSTNIDLPEQELFANAKRQYQNSLQSVSRESFKSIKNNFPTGPYTEFAEIKIADSFFANSEFNEALKLYEDYTKSRPASIAVPYALYMAARSAELSSAGAGRDPNPSVKSLTFYEDLIKRFPDSIYTESAKLRHTGVREILAEHEVQVINFYEQQGKEQIAQQRRKEFFKNYNVSADEFETSSYDKRSALDQSQITTDKTRAAKAYLISISNQLNNSDSSFAAANVSDISPANTVNSVPVKPASDKLFSVAAVVCDKENMIANLSLLPSSQIISNNLKAGKRGKEVQIFVENLTTPDSKDQIYSCFANGDLVINQQGTITLHTDSEDVKAFFAQNPSRIILSLN